MEVSQVPPKPFPHSIQNLEPDVNRQLLEHFLGSEQRGFVLVGPEKWCYPARYVEEAAEMYNLPLKSDDVFVLSFPRSGTTMTQEIVWLLSNNLDFKRASEVLLNDRFPFLEVTCLQNRDSMRQLLEKNTMDKTKAKIIQAMDVPAWEHLKHFKGQRFIQTHLSFNLLPADLLKENRKAVYIARNPKDVAVSFYYLNKSHGFHNYNGSFKQFWWYFKNNFVIYAPYWEHIKQAWIRRHEKNFLFIFYEDLTKNLKGTIEKISEFLGKSYSEEEVQRLVNHMQIDNFRKNKAVNRKAIEDLGLSKNGENGEMAFIRAGKTGGWKDYFDEDMTLEADEWISENLKDTDLSFP